MASEQREDLDDQFMENEVNNSFALIDVPVSPSDCFKKQYEGNANGNFLFGIDMLDRHYQAVRRVRGDGNCFFRGFLFALCEKLIENPDLNQKVLQKIQSSKQELIQIGYSEVAIDTFWETFVDYLTAMDSRSHQELVQDFQTERGEAEYLVWYMRLLTAGYLKKHAELFHPFIEGIFPGLTVEQFCAQEVEPMGKECDQPQIAALTQALEIGVKIEYLDGSTKENEPLYSYLCMPDQETSVYLLYRPGHYDILYPKQ